MQPQVSASSVGVQVLSPIAPIWPPRDQPSFRRESLQSRGSKTHREILENPLARFVNLGMSTAVATHPGMGNMGMLFMPEFLETPQGPSECLPYPLGTSSTFVAPILGAPAMGGGIGLAFSGRPASMVMAKFAVAPKFSGLQRDWVAFS